MHPIGLRKTRVESDHRRLRPTFQKGLRARESRLGDVIVDEQVDTDDDPRNYKGADWSEVG